MEQFTDRKMIPGLNFTAIDFETANRHRRSACSLGLAVVRNGEIVETKYWLIRPEPFEVDFYNQKIHGISIDMLKGQATFLELWAEIQPYLIDEVLVAHNASFDIDVLKKITEFYNIEVKYNYQFCTHIASGWCWPEIGSTRLADVSKFLNIDLMHHHAASDSLAAARIAIEMATIFTTNDLSNIKPTVIPNLKFGIEHNPEQGKFKLTKDSFRDTTSKKADLSSQLFSSLKLCSIEWAGKKFCVYASHF